MPKGTESTTKFKVDITEFKAAMQEAARYVKLAESEFNEASAGLGKWSDSAEGLTAKLKQLDKVLDAQKRQLDVLETEYERVAKEQGENSKGAEELRIQLNNQRAAVKKTESQMDRYSTMLEEVTKDAEGMGDAVEESGNQAKKSSDGFTVMKGALASLVADGIKLAIKGFKDLTNEAVNAYKEFDAGRDSVIKATGATGEAAEKLVDSYKNVAKSVKGDFNDIGSALGEVNTRFAFTGDKLEEATRDFVKFADITGTDATEAVKLVSRAMGDAGIDASEYKGLLDDLALAAQASGISIDGLTEMLTKYGAPMRALGFETKESIALFSSWEKAGVNTEIAFSGMKKAISNWSKEGKDSRKEFKKTLDEIKKTPNIAKATTKAIEVFGAKAGPDLADAIKEGRFEYEDFLELLDGSKGTVQNTYEETQDGFDKVQLAIQNARIKLADIVDKIMKKYGPEIEKFINSAVEGFDDFLNAIGKAFKFMIENGDEVLAILQSIAVAFVTYKAVSIISGVVSAIQGFITAVKAGETAMVALNTTMSISPIGLVAAAVAGLTVGIIALAAAEDKARKEQYGLNEAQQEAVDKANELKDEYEEMDSARDKSNNAIKEEYKYLGDLKDEYNSLIDENGKVKEGYEDRAEFILNQLAEAMGIERDEIDKTIEKNGELGKSINDLIIKQQAQATLDANKGNYEEAITKKGDALKTYQGAIEAADEAQKKYNQTLAEFGKDKEIYDELLASGKTGEAAVWYLNYYEGIEAISEAEKALEEAQTAVKNSEDAYVGYNQTIQNYEGLSAAIISGDVKKVKTELNNLTNEFITADIGNERILQEQAQKFKSNYESLQKAIDDGVAGVSKADVNAAKKLMDSANKEMLTYLKSSDVAKELKERGYKLPKSLTDGLKSGEIDLSTAVERLQNLLNLDKGDYGAGLTAVARSLGLSIPESIIDGIMTGQTGLDEADRSMSEVITGVLENVARDAGIEAEKIPVEIRSAVLEGEMTIAEAIEQMKGTMSSELSKDDGSAKEAGEKVGSDFSDGISSKETDAQTAGKALAQKAKSGADTKDKTTNSETSGTNFAQGFLDGMGSLVNNIWTKGKELAQKALAGLKKGQEEGSPSKLTTQSGVYFGEGYNNGIQSMVKSVVKSATNLGIEAVKSLQDAQEEGSPSKLTYKSGVNFTKGYINGIASMQTSLVKATKNVVKTALKELLKLNNFNFDEVRQNASSYVSDTMSKRIEYMTNKMAYQNEKKLNDFDKTILNLEKKRDKKLDALEKQQDKAKDKKQKAAIQKQINATKKEYERLINTQEKYKEAYQTASSKMLEEFNKAVSDYQRKAQDLIDSAIKGVTDKYQARYDSLINKQDELISKLKSAGDLFEISGAGVITVNDIKEQTKQIKDYADKLKKIKSKVSSDLFDQIASYDMQEGQAFINQLLSLSDAELKAYDKAYSEKMSLAESLSKDIYKSDFDKVAKEYKTEIKKAMSGIPKQLEALGKDSMKGFIDGLTKNTDYMDKNVKTFVKGMVNQFKKELKIKSPSRVMMGLGEFSGEGFGDGLKNMIGYVKGIASDIASATTTSLEGVKTNLGDVKSAVGTNVNGLPATSSTVVNNYNLVQNNTSPKSLSALETYNARRQQLAMVKAATQNA